MPTLRNMQIMGDGSGAIVAPSWVNMVVLQPGQAKEIPIPARAKFVNFTADCNFLVGYGEPPAMPSADVTDGSAFEMNPTMRYLGGVMFNGEQISKLFVLSSVAGTVSASFWSE